MTRLPFQRPARPPRGSSTPPPQPFRIAPSNYWRCDVIAGAVVPDVVGSIDFSAIGTMSVQTASPMVNGPYIKTNGALGVYAFNAVSALLVTGVASTFAFWFRVVSATNQYNTLFSHGNGSSLYVVGSPPNYSLVFYPATIGTAAQFATKQCVISYDGTTFRVYIDAVNVYTVGGFYEPTNETHLGTDVVPSRDGTFEWDEIAKFNIAFTQTDVSDLYAWGLAGKAIIPA